MPDLFGRDTTLLDSGGIMCLFFKSIIVAAVLAAASPSFAGNTEMVKPTSGTAYWTIDQANTTLLFAVNHSSLMDLYGYIPGRGITGGATIDDADFTKSKVDVTFQASELTTTFEFPFDVFKGEGGLDVEEYPEIIFSSEKIVKKGENYQVIGSLTMHGVTREIALDIEHASDICLYEGYKYRAFQAKTVINRQNYGMDWQEPEKLNHPLFSDEIRITMIFEVVNPAPEPMSMEGPPDFQKGSGKDAEPLYDQSANADGIRQRNMETIRNFLALDGMGDTTQFFADGGVFEQTFPFYGDAPTRMVIAKNEGAAPKESSGRPPEGEMPELTIDWKFFDETVHYTDDPNYIIIENYGSGKQLAATGEYVPYANHYFHTFRMESGLIREYREITNPLGLYKAFNIPVGHMPTPDETMKAVRKTNPASN
jgi:polyisoprenoid-binding protein YceI/ketosteroid isomerase-like protein